MRAATVASGLAAARAMMECLHSPEEQAIEAELGRILAPPGFLAPGDGKCRFGMGHVTTRARASGWALRPDVANGCDRILRSLDFSLVQFLGF